MKKSFKALTYVVLAAIALTSCSNSSASSSKGKSFETLLEMRDAFIVVGGDCSDWKQENAVKLALESGDCSDSNVLSIYSSRAAADEQNRAFKKMISEILPSEIEEDRPIHLLVGENWILNESDMKLLYDFQSKYGGDLITSYSQIP
jgi:hypothetical protein